MAKRVILTLMQGSFEQGFPVILRIKSDGDPASAGIQVVGQLPPAPNIPELFKQWQSAYRQIVMPSSRIKPKAGQVTNFSCHQLGSQLAERLNDWLNSGSSSWQKIRDRLQQNLSETEEIQVVIETDDLKLRQLPWNLWDLFSEYYTRAEIALSTSEYQPLVGTTATLTNKVRILAILGNSTGIDVQQDQAILEQLPHTEITFLVEPKRQSLSDQLWEQQWDILFFAGHSSSQVDGNTGQIYINQTDSLSLTELKNALIRAIERGMQLAIFNSCNGLGLARELAPTHIPQIVVMREPVPDKVAQEFLKYFLQAFASGKSLYLAVREARQRLQGIEDRFPCATWLPVICQNPAVASATWQDLGRRTRPDIVPYRGLFAFREEDAPFFYGRELFTKILVEAVQKHPLVAVIGPSGSGKSSVVFAGLIPRLRSLGTWRIVSFRPGDRPLHALAVALISQLEAKMSRTDRLREIRKLTADLRQEDNALRDIVDDMVWEDKGARLLLVADQFEELYTLCRDAKERQLFLDRLLKAVNHSRNFTLVITLRADFLGQALSYRPFADALQYADLKLGPMNRFELQDAVQKPAALLGVALEEGLSERILDAVSAQPGDLPLLEFALNQLWAKQIDGYLTHAAYDEIGGVEAALARYAEEAYGQLNEEEKERARRIFIQLVRTGDGTEDTRRLATRKEVGEENWDLVTRLANARLAVSSGDEVTGEETIELVHEALIKGWERLRLWIELDRAFRTWQERLRAAMRQWQTSGRDEGALLRGAPLAEAKGWLQSRLVELSPGERVFIQLSLELRDRERKEQERRRQRTILGLAGGLVVVSILAVGAFWQWQQAKTGRTNVELINLSTTSEALFSSNQEFEALIESIRAGRQLKRAFAVKHDIRMRVVLALQQAVYGVTEHNRLKGNRVIFSPDGKMLASVGFDKTMTLWSLDGRKVRTIREHDNSNFADVSFSPDGKMLATASYNSTVKLWSLDGTLLKTFKGQSKRILGADTRVSFSPDGKMLASASDYGTVNLWSLDGTLLKTFEGKGDSRVRITDTILSFSPNGKMLAVISSNAKLVLWNTNGTLLKVLQGSMFENVKTSIDKITIGVSFSPDGKMLALANSRSVKILNPNGTLLKTLPAELTDDLGSVSFSPDSKMLAVVVGGNNVKLWSLDSGKFKILKANTAAKVSSISFSPDGKMLATASGGDNTVKLWKLDGLEPKIPIGKQTGGAHSIYTESFSPDGKTIATASADKTVKLWSRNGTLLKTLSHGNFVTAISFSPNSRTLASASLLASPLDDTIKLWSTDGNLLKTFKGHGAYDVTFSPDGKLLVLGTLYGTIKLWSTDGREIKSLKGHKAQVTSVSFSPDGNILASASSGAWDHTVKLWSREGTLLKTFNFRYGSDIQSLKFSPDGRKIALASSDGTIKLWSTEGREIKTLKGHNDTVKSVSFSPDGKTLTSQSLDGTVKVWSIDGTEIKTFSSQSGSVITGMSFSPDGKILALGSIDGTVVLKSLDLAELLVFGCDWLHDYLKNSPNVSQSNQRLCDGIETRR